MIMSFIIHHKWGSQPGSRACGLRFRDEDRRQLIDRRTLMTSGKICDRCRELYAVYKNINEELSADVYSAQAAARSEKTA
jgi:hypothetical protein